MFLMFRIVNIAMFIEVYSDSSCIHGFYLKIIDSTFGRDNNLILSCSCIWASVFSLLCQLSPEHPCDKRVAAFLHAMCTCVPRAPLL